MNRHRGLLKPALTESGFTLVEMLVVVGIIGLLAAVSYPSYSKYRARALQNEAKSSLASIYAAEKLYVAENRTYTGCIRQLGVTNPDPERYYAYGFDLNAITANCGPRGGKTCAGYTWTGSTPDVTCAAADGYIAATSKNSSTTAMPTVFSLGTAATDVTRTAFKARASGAISSSASAYDKWTIDQDKAVINTSGAL